MPDKRIGDLEPTGRGTEMRVVAPTRCRNGHPLGPHQVEVKWLQCQCPGAAGGGHHSWLCITCADVQVEAAHTDDTLLGTVAPAPSLHDRRDAEAARQHEADGPNI